MNKLYNKILQAEEEGKLSIDISYRGGYYGARASVACELLGLPDHVADQLPNKVGAYCNYLGGGLRGAIVCIDAGDMIGHGVAKTYAKKIARFAELCKQRYNEIEAGEGLQDEDDFSIGRVDSVISAY